MRQPSGKRGELYLGAKYDAPSKSVTEDGVYVDAADLVTHGVCIGMTGSGKTGLCVALLEECALNDIPALIIDPKGDLTNLALIFPELDAASFRPWINVEAARRKDLDPDAYAAAEAEKWRKGLADWGIDSERLAAFRERVDVTLLTPGSTAGSPVNVLSSFDAPDGAAEMDAELLREQIGGSVSALLSLMGVSNPTPQDREHILLATILEQRWREGTKTTLTDLIHLIQAPPFQKMGAIEMDNFYPADDRRKLAFQLNALLASPSFQTWLTGEPLDMGKLLRTPDGRPRLAVCTLSHLSDAERMFFVSLILNQFVTWMRRQPGTPNLKAIFYFDEIYGYLPPYPKNPPSKNPLMTILKQGRATGTAAMLVTQNPVDLDYKALANCGFWMLGKLQTEQDKARILDGISGAIGESGGQADRTTLDRMLSSLGARVFLVHNIHSGGGPLLMHSRWAMSYLAGPMTREQISQIAKTTPDSIDSSANSSASASNESEPDSLEEFLGISSDSQQQAASSDELNVAPAPPKGLSRRFVAANSQGMTVYAASLYALADVVFRERGGSAISRQVALTLPVDCLETGSATWQQAVTTESLPKSSVQPPGQARFRNLPAAASSIETLKALGSSLIPHLVEHYTIELWSCPTLKFESAPGEERAAFEARVREALLAEQIAREAKLRSAADKEIARQQAKIDKERDELERDREIAATRKGEEMMSAVTSVGTALLSILGSKRKSSTVGKVGTVMRQVTTKRGMTKRAEMAVKESEQAIEAAQAAIEDIRNRLEADIAAMRSELDPTSVQIQSQPIHPAKTNITVREMGYLWSPITNC